MIVYLNGVLISDDQAGIPVNDRGLLLGDGVFTTLYYDGNELECFSAHYQRLQTGLQLFQFPEIIAAEELRNACHQVLTANALGTAAVRITVTRGSGPRGILPVEDSKPTVLITATPYQRSVTTLKARISQYLCEAKPPLSSVKHLGYQLAILGRLEAASAKVDDVIFANPEGNVVCSTSANIFACIDSVWRTPPLGSGALPGIRRGKLIQQREYDQKEIRVSNITIAELLNKAESILLTNSLIGEQVTYF